MSTNLLFLSSAVNGFCIATMVIGVSEDNIVTVLIGLVGFFASIAMSAYFMDVIDDKMKKDKDKISTEIGRERDV